MTLVAERAGVSVATVSHVLNGKAGRVSAETAARVQRIVDELGYRPSGAASTLKSRQSRLLAVLIANAANPTMAAIAASIEQAARRRNLVMVLCDTHEDPAIQDEHILEMRAQLVRGIVVVAAVESPQLSQLITDGAPPLVFVGRRPLHTGWGPYVGIDNDRAGADLAALLKERDLLPTAIIHGSLSSLAVADRVRGFRDALQADQVIDEVEGEPATDHLHLGYRALAAMLDAGRRPRSLFCASDLIAYGAHACCRERGLQVPESLAIVGFDDNPLNDWLAPWLTSVRVPYERFGECALLALARESDKQAGPVDHLPYELAIRW